MTMVITKKRERRRLLRRDEEPEHRYNWSVSADEVGEFLDDPSCEFVAYLNRMEERGARQEGAASR